MNKAAKGKLVTPVILAGGSGTRLWPLSSAERPKQFQQIAGSCSMFRQTLERVSDPERFSAPVIIGSENHQALIETELQDCGIRPAAIVLEPEGRNTAPAITLAGLVSRICNLSDFCLVMPSDHYIRDRQELLSAIDRAREAAGSGAFVTFGIEPDGPEDCYGYIKKGAPLAPAPATAPAGCDEAAGPCKVMRFVEKPSHSQARKMLKEGGYLWNSGMFLFPVVPLLDELIRLKPEIVDACQLALLKGSVDETVVRLSPEAFAKAENISIDYALMEKTDKAVVVPVDPLWSDVGSWKAVWQLSECDDERNVTMGDVVLYDVQGAYVRSEGPVTAVVGLEDVIVVNTGDAVIVAAKSHAQDIRHIAQVVGKQGKAGAEKAPSKPEPAKQKTGQQEPVRKKTAQQKSGPQKLRSKSPVRKKPAPKKPALKKPALKRKSLR